MTCPEELVTYHPPSTLPPPCSTPARCTHRTSAISSTRIALSAVIKVRALIRPTPQKHQLPGVIGRSFTARPDRHSSRVITCPGATERSGTRKRLRVFFLGSCVDFTRSVNVAKPHPLSPRAGG
ncbi:hypothetical protein LSAT2_013364 [Lamellibrachia satsuma]|nr:hypothetical protein LSAT2_013364 [Lamellibrachia satsuma]